MSCAVSIRNVSVTYHSHIALLDVSLEFHRGEFVGVIGPNGAGKTTLLTVINGLGQIHAGTVEVLGEVATRRNWTRLRRRIGYVPQHLNVDQRAPVSCFQAVMIGRLGRIGLLRSPGARDRELVSRMMELARIGHLRDRAVGQISGGEFQKVSVARALSQEPDILLLDEPTANLDPASVRELTSLIVDSHRHFNLTIVMVTHQLDHLPQVADRVVMVKESKVEFSGPRHEALVPERIAALWPAAGPIGDA